jgi:probable F420-dependent oxidoreductase
MHIGLALFPADTTLQPIDFGRAAEDLGFESVWFPEHSHIPSNRRTPSGGDPNAGPLPDYYSRTLEQFTALAAIAGVTTHLRLGSAVTLLAQRDPIWTAKQIATLDLISGGRAEVGLGYGWNVEEMEHHGTAYGERRAKLREYALTMRALWTEEEASFTGDHVALESSWMWPKPVQQPHPRMVMGAGLGPKTIADIVEFCDGWMPSGTRHDVPGGVGRLREAFADAGRDPDTLEVTVYGCPPEEAALEAHAELGVTRVLFSLPVEDPDSVLATMRDRSRFVGLF